MEDRISGGLQHCYETCYKKDGRRGRWACMVWRWFHHSDVVSGQVDLYVTILCQPRNITIVKIQTIWSVSI